MYEEPGGGGGKSGGKQHEHHIGHHEEVFHRHPQETEVQREPEGCPAAYADGDAGRQTGGADAADRHAVKEQHDLRSLAEHGEAHDQEEDRQGFRAGFHSAADALHFLGEFTAVGRHPHDMPSDHADRRQQHGRVENVLSGAARQRRDEVGAEGDQHGSDNPQSDAAEHETSAARDAAGRRTDDRDDERRFEHLAKDQ